MDIDVLFFSLLRNVLLSIDVFTHFQIQLFVLHIFKKKGLESIQITGE